MTEIFYCLVNHKIKVDSIRARPQGIPLREFAGICLIEKFPREFPGILFRSALPTIISSFDKFLPRDAMLARYYLSSCVCLSVRPSVRPSVTNRSCTKMAKPRIRLTTLYDSPETLVLRCQKSWRNSHDITPNGGAK